MNETPSDTRRLTKFRYCGKYKLFGGSEGFLGTCLKFRNEPVKYMEVCADVFAKINPKKIYVVNEIEDTIKYLDEFTPRSFLWYLVTILIVLKFLGKDYMVIEADLQHGVTMARATHYLYMKKLHLDQ